MVTSAAASSNRCGGLCCQRFPLSKTAEAIAADYAWATALIIACEDNRWAWDTVTIAEMIVPLHEEADELPQYTCVHLDRSAGLCTIYERRPLMCSEYPDYGRGDACQHCGFKNPTTGAECAKDAA